MSFPCTVDIHEVMIPNWLFLWKCLPKKGAHGGALSLEMGGLLASKPCSSKSNQFKPLHFVVNGFGSNCLFGSLKPPAILECEC